MCDEECDGGKEKDIEFYSATVNAWYLTRFEKDKHLLSLSSGGIALLVTLSTAVGVASICTAAMYILAVTSFLLCIISVLMIFSVNSDHLEKIIAEEEVSNPLLSALDKIAVGTFIFGIIFTLLVALFTSIHNFNI